MPAFARSVTPFLRTARFALQQGNAVSPLQHALRGQKGAAVLNTARCYATAFERTKPHVNIGKNQSFENGLSFC
jgi:elongation factor Tu